MYICYFDESGDASQPISFSPPHNIQPIFVTLGIFLEASNLYDFTRKFIEVKSTFHPHLFPSGKYLQRLMTEVKGVDIRADFRKSNKRRWKTHIQFLNEILNLLGEYNAKIVSHVFIKNPSVPFRARGVYTSAVQNTCRHFNNYLSEIDARGVVIADHRTFGDNKIVSFSVGTQKFQTAGDPYNRIIECPTFGCSDVHAGIQIADLIVSAIINPIAAYSFCLGHYTPSPHVSVNYGFVKSKLASQIKSLRYGYQSAPGKWCGGITIHDSIGHRNSTAFFR